jgi:hypothetical protein
MTPVNTKPLHDKMRKLRMVEEILADPELVELLLQMLPTANGKRPEAAKTKAKSASPKRAFTGRGDLEAAVTKALPYLSGSFTSRELIAKVESTGYVYTAKDKGIATSSSIKRLINKGILARADSSKNRKDFKYRRVSVPVQSN